MIDQAATLRRPHQGRFPGELEQAYQAHYYHDVRNWLRTVATLLFVLTLLYAGRDYLDIRSATLIAQQHGPILVLCTLVSSLTFVPGFGRVWQPVVVAVSWVATAFAFYGLATQLATAVPPVEVREQVTHVTRQVHFTLQVMVLMAGLSAFRLQFGWSLLLNAGMMASAAWAVDTRLPHALEAPFGDSLRFLQWALLVGFVLVMGAYIQEQLARHAFLANYLLDLERSDEQRKRVRTEGMLSILAQAIGGIAHDLGNPLTSVQLGASTLADFVEEGECSGETVLEFTDMILSGAEMLNYLRLSLMEQTRVLEGKPIPIEARPTAVRALVELGIRFQKPNWMYARQLEVAGPDLELCADAPKLTTVFMNLIGNALKYSDGPIHITWRPHEDRVLIAIQDAGVQGRGITAAQAEQLFVPFGRLDAHENVEGTGLGLLSVRRVVEAHGGEVFVEGHHDGTPSSPTFSTARGDYPSMRPDGISTAFVVCCPGVIGKSE